MKVQIFNDDAYPITFVKLYRSNHDQLDGNIGLQLIKDGHARPAKNEQIAQVLHELSKNRKMEFNIWFIKRNMIRLISRHAVRPCIYVRHPYERDLKSEKLQMKLGT